MAEMTGDLQGLARVLEGQANGQREVGDYAGARELLERMKDVVSEFEEPKWIGRAAHGLMAVEATAGRPFHAAHHGWKAVEAFGGGDEYFLALIDLGGVLTLVGDYEAAEDAFQVVREKTNSEFARIAAEASLVGIAGRRGDVAEFEARAAEFDATVRLELNPPHQAAQIMLDRAEVLIELGRPEDARTWTRGALETSVTHGYAELQKLAESMLADTAGDTGFAPTAPPAPGREEQGFLLEARGGVRALRGR